MENTHLQDDVRQKVRGCIDIIRLSVVELAERHAEVYVSSTLGLSDDEDRKKFIKDTYIEEFTNQAKKTI